MAVMQNGLRHAAQDRALDRVKPSGAAHDQRRINLVGSLDDRQPDGRLRLLGAGLCVPTSLLGRVRSLLRGLPRSRFFVPVRSPSSKT